MSSALSTFLPLLLLPASSSGQATAVRVASLQESGLFTTSTYVRTKGEEMRADLDDATVCLWFYLAYMRSRRTWVASYATKKADNAMQISESN